MLENISELRENPNVEKINTVPQVYIVGENASESWCRKANLFLWLYMSFNDDRLERALNAFNEDWNEEEIEDEIVHYWLGGQNIDNVIKAISDEELKELGPYIKKLTKGE